VVVVVVVLAVVGGFLSGWLTRWIAFLLSFPFGSSVPFSSARSEGWRGTGMRIWGGDRGRQRENVDARDQAVI